MDDKSRAKMIMHLSNAVHQLGMALVLLGESIEEDKDHDFDYYIEQSEVAIKKAKEVV